LSSEDLLSENEFDEMINSWSEEFSPHYFQGLSPMMLCVIMGLKRIHDQIKFTDFLIPDLKVNKSSTWSFDEIANSATNYGTLSIGFINDLLTNNEFLSPLNVYVSFEGGIRDTQLECIKKISEIDLSDRNFSEKSIFAKCFKKYFEGLLTKFQIFDSSSCSLNKVLVNLLNLQPDQEFYNPFSGTAGLIVAVQNASIEKFQNFKNLFFSQEKFSDIAALGNLNLIVHGVNQRLEIGDVLSAPQNFIDNDLRRFDHIVCALPIGARIDDQTILKKDQFRRFLGHTGGSGNADRFFILHVLKSLSDKGRAIVSISPSFLMNGGADRKVRKKLLDLDIVEAVLLIPTESKRFKGMPEYILILNKNKPCEKKEKVFFGDFEIFSESTYLGRRHISDESVTEIVSKVNKFQRDSHSSEVVDNADVKKWNCNLNVRLYTDNSVAANKARRLVQQHQNYRLLSLFDPQVSKSINLVKKEETGGSENTIYFPSKFNGFVTTDLEEARKRKTTPRSKIYKALLNENYLLNEYAAQFYSTELGQAMLESAYTSSPFKFLSIEGVQNSKIAFPPIDVQKKMILSSSKLKDLNNILSNFEKQISLNPQSTDTILEKVDDILSVLNALSDSDLVRSLVREGETKTIEFKETLRLNMHTQSPDAKMESMVIKTVAAFMNSDGGHLLVGVDRHESIVGINKELEKFKWNTDKYLLHFRSLFKERIGMEFIPLVDQKIINLDDTKVLIVAVKPSNREVFVDGSDFYIRSAPATDLLRGRQVIEYINTRFSRNDS
jgi:type I restriction-modification system DNA methylase subunit